MGAVEFSRESLEQTQLMLWLGAPHRCEFSVREHCHDAASFRWSLFMQTCQHLIRFLLFAISGTAALAEPTGTLFIVGGGDISAEVRAEFFRLAGGKERAKIVVIPTASEFADDPKEDESYLAEWRKLAPVSVERLHTRDREIADDPKFVAPLADATAVWISGGDQNRLVEAYRGTLVEEQLHELLARGGEVGGTSAGAAVMSDLMIQGGDQQATTGPGLALLKGIVIDQHFIARGRITRLRGVLADYPRQAGLGIDEGTAAVVSGNSLIVKGKSTVTLFWPRESPKSGEERVLKAGDELDLATVRLRVSR